MLGLLHPSSVCTGLRDDECLETSSCDLCSRTFDPLLAVVLLGVLLSSGGGPGTVTLGPLLTITLGPLLIAVLVAALSATLPLGGGGGIILPTALEVVSSNFRLTWVELS